LIQIGILNSSITALVETTILIKPHSFVCLLVVGHVSSQDSSNGIPLTLTSILFRYGVDI